MAESFKQHSVAIITGCFGSALFWLVTVGGSLVAAIYAALSAHGSGLPAYKAILLGAWVALILVLMLFLARELFTRFQGSKTTTTGCHDKWLHDIAEDQVRTLYRWVHLKDCSYSSNSELLRSDPFVEFSLIVDNRSVYDVCFDDLAGYVDFAGRRLNERVTWEQRPDSITHGNVAQLVIHQPLTKDDAIHILNTPVGGMFGFSKLEIKAAGYGDSKNFLNPRPLHTDSLYFTNEELLKQYPKLQLKINSAHIQGLWEPDANIWIDGTIGSIINLEVHFDNPRRKAVDILSFKLDNSPNMNRVTLAAQGEIFNLPNKSFPSTPLDNLNSCPIHAEKGISFDGWLQFILRGIQPQTLVGGTPTLIVVDSSGEEHSISCPVLHRE
jgi:hypothetical protein